MTSDEHSGEVHRMRWDRMVEESMSDRAYGPRFSEAMCPECGEPTQVLHEGYCPDCCEYRQAMLDFHIFQYDRWDKMTESERDVEIKRAMR